MGTFAVLPLALSLASLPAPERAPGVQTVELGVASGAYFPGERQATLMPEHAPSELRGAGFGFSLRLSYLPFTFLGVEAEAGHVALETTTKVDADMYALRGHLIAQLPGRFTPFALAGAGVLGMAPPGEQVQRQRDLALHWGLGLKYFAQSDVVVRVEGRHSICRSDSGSTSEFEVLAGMSFALTRD